MGTYNIDKIPHVTYSECLDIWAEKFKQKTAVIENEKTITYAELKDRSERMAAFFLKKGIKSGDRVIVQLNNSILFVVCCFAMFKAGIIPVLVYPACREKELESISETAQPTGYILFRNYKGHNCEELSNYIMNKYESISIRLFDDELEQIDLSGYSLDDCDYKSPEALDTALIILSGGSTGVPKLIARTHADHIFTSAVIAEKCGFSYETVYMISMPIEHNFNTVGMIGTLNIGGTVVMCITGSTEEIITLMKKHEVTATALVPSMAMACASAVQRNDDKTIAKSMKLLQIGGAMCTQEVVKNVTSNICTVQQIYGMGEGIVFCTTPDDDMDTILNSQGANTCEWDDIRIVDPNGKDVPYGDYGELIGRGPCIITEYYNCDPAVNLEKFTEDGYLKTGDRARFVNEKYLQIVGRIKDVINRGGEKIDPSEIEQYLQECNGIKDAVVIGLPDKLLGEKICAVVIADENGIDSLAIKRQLISKGIAFYKVPDCIYFVEAWPLTAVKKVDRQALREFARKQDEEENSQVFAVEQSEFYGDEIETKVAGIWAEILRCSISREDNFIDLGGNSLTSSLMLERVNSELEVEIAMNEFYENSDFENFVILVKEKM